MKINAKDIEDILPKGLRHVCKIGVCDPLYLERKKPVFCHIPIELWGPRWSAKPTDVLPSLKSIIVLIHFTCIGVDYSVRNIILLLADILWKKLRIKTHVLNKLGKPDKENLIGGEDSFLKSTSYDARKKMILFKELAYYAGLGQYGKNSLIINHHFGSDIKIQALFTEAELEYDEPILPKRHPRCKKCNICIEACPGRIIHNYKVISLHEICKSIVKLIVKDKSVIIGRLPKKREVWDKALRIQQFACRVCQSFCPVNLQHYQNKLVLLKESINPELRTFQI